jgi:hypothetical protein
VNIKAHEVFFEEQLILIAKAKGGQSRSVPISASLARELTTHPGDWRSCHELPVRNQPPHMLLSPENPPDYQGNSGRRPNHEADVSTSPKTLEGHNPLREGYNAGVDPEIPRIRETRNHADLCRVDDGDG